MTDDPKTLHHIASWLNSLAKLTQHKQGRLSAEDVATMREERALYATMLVRDLPAGAFTVDSLHATVRGHDFFPSYNAIRRAVGTWWQDNQPPSTLLMLTGPGSALSREDVSWYEMGRRRLAEMDARQPRGVRPNQWQQPTAWRDGGYGSLVSNIERHSPMAARLLWPDTPPPEHLVDPEALRSLATSVAGRLTAGKPDAEPPGNVVPFRDVSMRGAALVEARARNGVHPLRRPAEPDHRVQDGKT